MYGLVKQISQFPKLSNFSLRYFSCYYLYFLQGKLGERGPDGAPGPPGPEVCSHSVYHNDYVQPCFREVIVIFLFWIMTGFPW